MGDPGSIPGSGRSPGEENGNPLQYSCIILLILNNNANIIIDIVRCWAVVERMPFEAERTVFKSPQILTLPPKNSAFGPLFCKVRLVLIYY